MHARYARIAEARQREIKVRVGFAVFIACTVWALAPSKWPAIWLALVFAGQSADWIVFGAIRRLGGGTPSRGLRIAACISLFVNSIFYSAIAAYLWADGGGSQMVFGSILIAGALLHVTIHLYHEREILISAATPPVVYFLALPVIHGYVLGQPTDLLVAVGCVLYMTHLLVAVRQSSQTNRAIQIANDRAQEERRRAEVASAAKSDFLAVVSHEIRTPMNAVVTSANLLERSQLDPAQKEHVVMLKDASQVLIGLLNDVLDFSKIEAGKMELEEAPVDLVDKLKALERMWAPKAQAAGVAFEVSLPDDLPRHVRTDPLRLQQILFNLVSNAVKFTATGRIEVRARWNAALGRLTVAVTDTGCGIPDDRLPYVFDVFEQVDAGVTRRHGGSGLGLAITCKLAQLMGGSVSVESRLGEGSIFTVDLPMGIAAAPSATLAVSAPSTFAHGLDILAVDDHPVNRRIVALLLEPMGCVLTFAENGQEAVEAAALRRFDAILMDMQMPVMDGLTATRAIRSDGPNAGTPVIALTANALETHRAAWATVGVDDFVTKPIDPARLASALEAAVRGEAALAATA
ncbi:MAG: ATP-binding protein [Brevundimonas aurantiaca]|uniref:ATP-binding protein n=1 Tax=Brevundimonas aurantiaca TaxID=74316 RepID=UPI0040344802